MKNFLFFCKINKILNFFMCSIRACIHMLYINRIIKRRQSTWSPINLYYLLNYPRTISRIIITIKPIVKPIVAKFE